MTTQTQSAADFPKAANIKLVSRAIGKGWINAVFWLPPSEPLNPAVDPMERSLGTEGEPCYAISTIEVATGQRAFDFDNYDAWAPHICSGTYLGQATDGRAAYLVSTLQLHMV